jgi:hypothetical protein
MPMIAATTISTAGMYTYPVADLRSLARYGV